MRDIEDQGLFPLDEVVAQVPYGVDVESLGYRAPAVIKVVEITYRQLDYWARTGVVAPSVRTATGSGTQRLYSFKDVLALKVVKRLLDAGVSLQNVRLAVEHLRQRGVKELATVTLFSDGVGVYECGSGEEVIDLLRGGQGVFGIAISGAIGELAGAVVGLPAERIADESADGQTVDELTAKRRSKARAS